MKNILVTIDFEKNGQLLIEKAAEIAVKFGAKLWLVHVAAPDPEFIGYEVGPQYVRDVLAKDLREEHKLLQKFSAQLKEKNIDAEGLLVQGTTIETIVELTQKLAIDLIVIGKHKYGFFHKTFMVSTDESLLELSNVPVLVVPLKD
ncbi:MAG: universal stress protein [Flavobacteriales bacterium]|nr:MAG: universal stress protein [Flavobacteriales bacterium]HRN40999.1 universal stress protein [Vicingus sp.]MBE7441473.1 universal stress protein [Flavobacteriales bacterium]MBX2960336.1 universal stress protein [Flavobacteriales bacterium]MCL4855886.1 universal stress protein [Flavobacteriales bacterium]